MASLQFDADNNRWQIQVICPDKKRRSIYLRGISEGDAHKIENHIERLAKRAVGKLIFDDDDASLMWLRTKQGKGLRPRLEKLGLVKSEPKAGRNVNKTLTGFLDDFFAALDVKPGTATHYGHTRKNLMDHFGVSCPLRDITPEGADKWRQSLRESGLAKATIARRVKVARQMFKKAFKWRLIADNPFDDLVAGSQENRARLFFVDRPTIEKVIAQTTDPEWRLLIALARYGGFRTPTESLALRLDDVDWEAGRILVRSCKTEHIEGKDCRVIPLFPELVPYLLTAREKTPDGAEYFINRQRTKNPAANLRTQFKRIIERAGVKPWPRLWQNLRASRETELTQEYPLHVVTAWIGNSPKVARAHYLSVTDDDYRRAAGPNPAGKSSAVLSAHSGAPAGTTSQTADDERDCDAVGCGSTACEADTSNLVGPEGFEPPTK